MTQPVIVFDQASVRQLQRNLSVLPRRVAIKHLRIGLNAAGGEAKKVAVATSARETGLLSKSHIVKVTIPDASHNTAHHGKPARVIVGPSRKVRALVRFKGGERKTVTLARLKKTGFRGNLVSWRKPSRYSHLAEKKSPAIANAQNALATTGMERLRQKIEQGIAQEAAALAK